MRLNVCEEEMGFAMLRAAVAVVRVVVHINMYVSSNNENNYNKENTILYYTILYSMVNAYERVYFYFIL